MVTVISAFAWVSVELWHDFIAFRVHQQECLLFTENTEREAGQKRSWGNFHFQGVCKEYSPTNVWGISKLE